MLYGDIVRNYRQMCTCHSCTKWPLFSALEASGTRQEAMATRITILLLLAMRPSRLRERSMHARHIARSHDAHSPRTECDDSCALGKHQSITLHTYVVAARVRHENRGGSQTAFAAERSYPVSLVFVNTSYLHEMND